MVVDGFSLYFHHEGRQNNYLLHLFYKIKMETYLQFNYILGTFGTFLTLETLEEIVVVLQPP